MTDSSGSCSSWLLVEMMLRNLWWRASDGEWLVPCRVLLNFFIATYANNLSNFECLLKSEERISTCANRHAWTDDHGGYSRVWGHCRWLLWPARSLCRPTSVHAPSCRPLLIQQTVGRRDKQELVKAAAKSVRCYIHQRKNSRQVDKSCRKVDHVVPP